MINTILVADDEELQKLAETLPLLTSALNGGSKYVPAFTIGRKQQLVLMQNGEPMIAYKSASSIRSADDNVSCIFGFIERTYGNKHLVMLYDRPALARRVEFHYVKHGLEKMHERCIYILPDDDVESVESIRNQMDDFGIDTKKYLGDGSLKIEKIVDPTRDREGFRAGCERVLQSLTANEMMNNAPLRSVLHVKYRFATIEEARGHAEFEATIQSEFASRKIRGSMLCNHYVGEYDRRYDEWMKKMLQTHDSAFLIRNQN